VRAVLVVSVAALVLGGCLGSSSEPPRSAAPVRGTIELHVGRCGGSACAVATATTRAERFILRGAVQPGSSEVRLLDGATHEQSAIARRRGATFAFTLEHLQAGANRYLLEATYPKRAPWRQAVRIVRRGPRTRVPRSVIVPREDPTPAEAELRLDRRRLVAVAIGRDPGGMARIRVSADLQLRCRASNGKVFDVALVRHEPPPRVGETRVVPGTRVPGELRRRSDVRAAARAGCAQAGGTLVEVRGVVWAEATNAHGRDRYSAYVRLRG
jgi:hypothetical protein